ncbi:hypothetical protein, partial [Treponema endosymbiont of Eucomonympha sp.]|uniref:hypothetical protein n=1 Tax=Treponema endosymbiont of Eucomonympha sp. TaxID=1580831 RepID=UPI001EE6E6F6
ALKIRSVEVSACGLPKGESLCAEFPQETRSFPCKRLASCAPNARLCLYAIPVLRMSIAAASVLFYSLTLCCSVSRQLTVQ